MNILAKSILHLRGQKIQESITPRRQRSVNELQLISYIEYRCHTNKCPLDLLSLGHGPPEQERSYYIGKNEQRMGVESSICYEKCGFKKDCLVVKFCLTFLRPHGL